MEKAVKVQVKILKRINKGAFVHGYVVELRGYEFKMSREDVLELGRLGHLYKIYTDNKSRLMGFGDYRLSSLPYMPMRDTYVFVPLVKVQDMLEEIGLADLELLGKLVGLTKQEKYYNKATLEITDVGYDRRRDSIVLICRARVSHFERDFAQLTYSGGYKIGKNFAIFKVFLKNWLIFVDEVEVYHDYKVVVTQEARLKVAELPDSYEKIAKGAEFRGVFNTVDITYVEDVKWLKNYIATKVLVRKAKKESER